MIHCEIYKTVARTGISDKLVKTAVRTVVRRLYGKKGIVAVHFIGQNRMRRLNVAHRGVKRATDVLSFPGSAFGGEQFKGNDLGDIFLCPSFIYLQAGRFDVSYTEECVRMLIHGILHILGYDHMKKKDARRMFALQEKFLHEIYV